MKYLLSLFFICGAAWATVHMYSNRPLAKKETPPQQTPLVKAIELRKTSVPVTVEAYGTVVRAREYTVQADVTGRIIHQASELTLGGLIPAGAKLIQVDPEDYQLLVKELEAALIEAKFEVELEQGRRIVAKRELKLLEKEISTSETTRRLVLRQPHQERAAARVQIAESRLKQARLDEKRTTLTCPFNAMVLNESVELGQLVSSKTKLATLVGTDQFWVQVSVPLAKLPRITFASGKTAGSPVKVICDTANGSPIVRQGRVLRLLGDLDTGGRMARVLVAIDNPLDLTPGEANGPAKMGDQCILLGCYAKVEIQAGKQDDVYLVSRSAVREGDRLWLVDADNNLVFRHADVIWRRQTDMLVRCDVKSGEKLVVSRLSSPLNGTKVRVMDPAATQAATTSRPTTQPAEVR